MAIQLDDQELDYMVGKAFRLGERFIIKTDRGKAAIVSLEDLEVLQEGEGAHDE